MKIRAKKFNYFIGIDVSKNKLDYAVIKGKELLFHQVGKNETDDITTFFKKLKGLPGFTVAKAIFCLEQTGIYGNHLLYALKKLKANIVLEHPLQIKRSIGLVRGKDDKSDSIRIAEYAKRNANELKFWIPRRLVVLELMSLFTLRNRLLGVSNGLKNPLKEEIIFVKKGLQKQTQQLCRGSIKAIECDLSGIDLSIESLINSDESLKNLKQMITSVPCVGPITAIQIIISTNEFKDIKDPKKFACYAGVAPFKKESGLVTGRAKVSPYANRKVKALLHVCALNAIRFDEELKSYYERKTKVGGKLKLKVINAVRYKLILRIFACVNQSRSYIKNYKRENPITAGE
ncbi:IS110 family transposase [Mucilaginibacter sp. McL0603]|uniref:IS110 family transposase n=1 Tax=Mucilaginibacter sp. McL0603 TaxID=3415670 RepID=UPI003CEE0C47